MRSRYLNNPNPGSAKVPSILYYDRNGHFRGVDNGVNFQDNDELLKMKWLGDCSVFTCAINQQCVKVEDDALALRAACCDERSDEHETPKGENNHRCIRRFYALPLRLDRSPIQVFGAKC